MKAYIGPYNENGDEQRPVDIEFENYDFFNLDQTLAIVIHAALVEYRNNHMIGCPAVNDEYVPDDLKTGTSDEDPEIEFSMAKWEYAVDKMILAFHEISTCEREDALVMKYKNKSPNVYATKEMENLQDDINAGLFFFSEYFRGLWT